MCSKCQPLKKRQSAHARVRASAWVCGCVGQNAPLGKILLHRCKPSSADAAKPAPGLGKKAVLTVWACQGQQSLAMSMAIRLMGSIPMDFKQRCLARVVCQYRFLCRPLAHLLRGLLIPIFRCLLRLRFRIHSNRLLILLIGVCHREKKIARLCGKAF